MKFPFCVGTKYEPAVDSSAPGSVTAFLSVGEKCSIEATAVQLRYFLFVLLVYQLECFIFHNTHICFLL